MNKIAIIFYRKSGNMADEEDTTSLGRWKINTKLLPIKLFYFFMIAGIGN